MIMKEIKISIMDSSRQKIEIIINRETKEELINNIDLGRNNLDKWLRE